MRSLILFAVLLISICNNSVAQKFVDINFPFNQLSYYLVLDHGDNRINDIVGFRNFDTITEVYFLKTISCFPLVYESKLISTQSKIVGRPVAGDIDNDNDVDIIFAQGQQKRLSVYENNGLNQFSIKKSNVYGIDNLKIDDVDLDGDNDIIGFRDFPGLVKVVYNGSGLFVEQTVYNEPFAIVDITTINLNKSKHKEICIAYSAPGKDNLIRIDKDTVSGLFVNRGTIREIPLIRKLEAFDFNQDSFEDLVCLTQSKIDLMLCDSNFNLKSYDIIEQNELNYSDLDIGDYDIDGKIDIIASRSSNTTTLFRNITNDSLLFKFEISVVGNLQGANPISTSDLDNDGDLDFIEVFGKLSIHENVLLADRDKDGFSSEIDCNEQNAAINPGAKELCDGVDNNCDGLTDEGFTIYTYYVDFDEDGFGQTNSFITSCSTAPPFGYALTAGDCDDYETKSNPNMIEICDSKDNDCDTSIDEGLVLYTYFLDFDEDGFGTNQTITTCLSTPENGLSNNNTDCDDNDRFNFPGGLEFCDGRDNNCNGLIDEGLLFITYFKDNDGDGFGSNSNDLSICNSIVPAGYVSVGNDCNDNNASINPDSPEICDRADNNCNGTIDEGQILYYYYIDNDGDGYGSASFPDSVSCFNSIPVGFSDKNSDCNDDDPNMHPNKPELCDGIDNDCDSTADEGLPLFTYYEDKDGDGFGTNVIFTTCLETAPIAYATNNTDCDDSNAFINPSQVDFSANSIDEDCSGTDYIVSTDNLLDNLIQIIPNPANDIIQINIDDKHQTEITIINNSGVSLGNYDQNTKVNISDFPAGHYLIKVYFIESKMSIYKQLIIKK